MPLICYAVVPLIPYVHAGMLGQPESPRWLAQKGRRNDAEETARQLWGSEGAAQLGETSTSGVQPLLPSASVGMSQATRICAPQNHERIRLHQATHATATLQTH